MLIFFYSNIETWNTATFACLDIYRAGIIIFIRLIEYVLVII